MRATRRSALRALQRLQDLAEQLLILDSAGRPVIGASPRLVDVDELVLILADELRRTTALDIDTSAVSGGQVLSNEIDVLTRHREPRLQRRPSCREHRRLLRYGDRRRGRTDRQRRWAGDTGRDEERDLRAFPAPRRRSWPDDRRFGTWSVHRLGDIHPARRQCPGRGCRGRWGSVCRRPAGEHAGGDGRPGPCSSTSRRNPVSQAGHSRAAAPRVKRDNRRGTGVNGCARGPSVDVPAPPRPARSSRRTRRHRQR